MANFDEDIQRITEELLTDGTVEDIFRKKAKKGFEDAIDDAFRWGELKDAIKGRIKEILVPYIESYDMSGYIVKLDTVLTEIVNKTALQDNAKILDNFKKLMIEPEGKFISLEDIFGQYRKYVAKHMDTTGRDIGYDDGPYYEPMEVTAEIVEEEDRPWSSLKHAVLELSVAEEEQQESLNFSIRLSRWEESWEEKGYAVNYEAAPSVKGMKYLDDFEIYILRLVRAGVRLLDDMRYAEDSVIAEGTPEPTYV